jgi:DNA-binding MarR family transcriptional regulator
MNTPTHAGARAEPGLSLGALSRVVGYHLAQAGVVTTAAYERHIGEPFGLRKVEFSLLMLLLANGALAPKRLALTLALTAPSLTLLLDRLQQRGLLRRERNPADGRSQHIVLTDAGKAFAREAARVAGTMEDELAARLTPAEHAMLIELLCKVMGRTAR